MKTDCNLGQSIPSTTSSTATALSSVADPRRHDLDALRGFAMLLGIGLHGALAFAPMPWMVQDTQQSGMFYLFFGAVHGFRMPLFFLLSGFFTAMLWQRRGLWALLKHRFRRVFVPCMLALITIVPLQMWLSFKIAADKPAHAENNMLEAATQSSGGDIWISAIKGKHDLIHEHAAKGTELNAHHPFIGASPVSLSALYDRPQSIELLLELGADVNSLNRDGGTALHNAAFLGRAEVVQILLENGANWNIQNDSGLLAVETSQVDWETTATIAGLLQIKVLQGEVEQGRAQCEELIRDYIANHSDATFPPVPSRSAWTKFYGKMQFLMSVPLFHHLWFLWYLCWLVPVFAVVFWVSSKSPIKMSAGWLKEMVVSPLRFLWLIPLTMIFQWEMGKMGPSFGPDTSLGLIPMPHIFGYYAVFFGFGAMLFVSPDEESKVGRWWWAALPVGLLVVFPIAGWLMMGGLSESASAETVRGLSVLLQVIYAWMMTFGLMGLFSRVLSSENKRVRYLSDSAYWLYLAHLPLVLAMQWWVRDWEWPALVKFVFVCAAVSAMLLVSYEWVVRYTWVGAMLNGRKVRGG